MTWEEMRSEGNSADLGGTGNISLTRGTYRFDSCSVYQAGLSMGVFNIQDGSTFLGY